MANHQPEYTFSGDPLKDENIEIMMLVSQDGTEWILRVDNNGVLYTEERS